MSLKFTTKNINVNELFSKDSVNVRFSGDTEQYGVKVDLYNLNTLIDQIKEATRVLEPLSVEKVADGYNVLRGNRRLRAVLAILADKSNSAELLEAISKLTCHVYTDLTDSERASLINDHGTRLRLSSAEVIHAVWRMRAEGRSNEEIALTQYYNLLDYAGNHKAAEKLPKEQGEERTKAVKRFFLPVLDQKIFPVGNMTERVRNCFIQNELRNEGKLPEGVKPLFNWSQDRMKKLITARGEDYKANLWDLHAGGPTFNELVEKFIEDDKNPTGPVKRSKTLKELEGIAPHYRSTPVKMALALAMGNTVDQMQEIDQECARMQEIFNILIQGGLDGIKDDKLKAFAAAMLHKTPSQFKEYLATIS